MSYRRAPKRDDDSKIDFDLENQNLLQDNKSSMSSSSLFPTYKGFKYPKNDEDDHSITRFAPEPPRFFYKEKVGKMYAITRHRVFGPCWIMTCVTAGLIFIVPFSLVFTMKHKLRTNTIMMTGIWVTMTLFALFLTSCTNPGIYPIHREIPLQDDETDEVAKELSSKKKKERFAYCRETESYRPPGVVFDQECGVLIRDVDHFCPWVGTTIGAGNICRFFCFVALLLLSVVWILFVAMADAGLLRTQRKYK